MLRSSSGRKAGAAYVLIVVASFGAAYVGQQIAADRSESIVVRKVQAFAVVAAESQRRALLAGCRRGTIDRRARIRDMLDEARFIRDARDARRRSGSPATARKYEVYRRAKLARRAALRQLIVPCAKAYPPIDANKVRRKVAMLDGGR